MTWFLRLLILLFVAGIAVQLYARWPRDFTDAHETVDVPEAGDGLWVVPSAAWVSLTVDGAPGEVLDHAQEVILATPRTEVVAATPEDGRVTYVTRTAFWGFADLTTVQVEPEGDGTRLRLHGRMTFTGNDWGVNRARIAGWLEAMGLKVPEDRSETP